MRARVQTVLRLPRRRLAGVAVTGGMLVLAAFAGLRAYLAHLRERELQLASAIVDAGGKVQLRAPFRERIRAIVHGQRAQGTRVFLGRGFDDDWIRRHDQLSDLRLEMLTIGEADLSGDGLAALLAEQPVAALLANREELTDEAVAALADNGNLRSLVVAYSNLNDDQLSRLPLERLERLDISGTQVTAIGIRQVERCGRLRELDLDGRQFDSSTVEVLNSLPSLERLQLCGAEVTDDHLQQLHGLTRNVQLRYWQTSTSEEARTVLCQIQRERRPPAY